MENHASLAAFDRPERLVVASTNDTMDIDVSYTFARAGEGTKVSVSTDVRPKGLLSILSPLLRLAMRRELAKHEVVKQACETERSLR